MDRNDMLWDFSACSVLIVDDEPLNWEVVAFFLQSLGVSNLHFARDGIEGLEQLNRRAPDLVVVDMLMPRLDGYGMLRAIRADDRFRDLPVIVQTANDSADSRDLMFSAGATDYVTKPLSAQEFQSRIRVHLTNQMLIKQLESQLNRFVSELSDAAALQRAMLPAEAKIAGLRLLQGIDTEYRFEPSSLLGGDFFGFIPVDDDVVGLYLCDFAGHGIGPALNTVRLHGVLSRLSPPDPSDPAAYLSLIYDELLKVMTERLFATVFLGFIDTRQHTFTYVSAGAPNPLLIGQDGSLTWFDGRGAPFGLHRSPVYENRVAPFRAGDRILLYSDALIETRKPDGEMLGCQGVERLVGQLLAGQGAQRGFVNRLITLFQDSTVAPLQDDLTIVSLERLTDPPLHGAFPLTDFIAQL